MKQYFCFYYPELLHIKFKESEIITVFSKLIFPLFGITFSSALDPQSNLTTYLGLKSKIIYTLPELFKTVMDNVDISDDKLRDMVNDSIIKTPDLDVIPSHINMSTLEIGIAMVTRWEYILKRLLDTIKEKYSFILLDCLPSLGIFALNALTASDSVIIPVETQIGGLEGFDPIITSINMVKRHLNPNLKIEGVIMTRYLTRTNLCKSIRDYLAEECGGKLKLFEPPIPKTVRIGESQEQGISVYELDKNNAAAEAYETIAKEVLRNAQSQNLTS